MTLPSAGWYPDPEDSTRLRWWDGGQWTENRSNFQAPPVTEGFSMNPASPSAPAGTPWSTVWIWILVFLPYVSSLGIFTIDWSSMFSGNLSSPTATASAELAMVSSPGYLFVLFGSWISYALFVWFAYLDWRTLVRRGVPKPFHWAWGFLTIVYTIGRSVVVRRRTGHGISPMWVSIILYIVVVIGTLVYMGVMMASLFGQISRY